MDIFKGAIMTYRRILEYKAMMATPEGKEYRKAEKAKGKAWDAVKKAEKAVRATPKYKAREKAENAVKATPEYEGYIKAKNAVDEAW